MAPPEFPSRLRYSTPVYQPRVPVPDPTEPAGEVRSPNSSSRSNSLPLLRTTLRLRPTRPQGVVNTGKLAQFNIMKWFKKKNKKARTQEDLRAAQSFPQHRTPPVSSQTLARLPTSLLERMFAFVCPHAKDETYESCEDSAAEDTCMLCDLRDLSHCAQVSMRWRAAAVNVL